MRRSFYIMACLVAIAMLLMQAVVADETGSATTPEKKEQPKGNQIRWKFKSGQTLTYEYSETFQGTMTGEGDAIDTQAINQKFDIKTGGTLVFEPNDDGNANLTISLESSENEGGQGDFLQSSPGGATPKQLDATVTIKPDGTVYTEEGENNEVITSVRSMLDMFFQMPPEPEIRQGESWDKELEYLTQRDDSTEGSVSTTFVGWEKQGASRYAKFEYSLNITSKKSQGPMEMNMAMKGKGIWRFDPSIGKLVDSNFSYTIEVLSVIDVPPGEGPDGQGMHIEVSFNGEGVGRLNQKRGD